MRTLPAQFGDADDPETTCPGGASAGTYCAVTRQHVPPRVPLEECIGYLKGVDPHGGNQDQERDSRVR